MPCLPVRKTAGLMKGCQTQIFASCETTGDASSCSIAHSLAYTPTVQWVAPSFFGIAGGTIALGTADNTNLQISATACLKFYAFAF